MTTIKTIEYFTNEVFKTVEHIETYFTTVQQAIEYFELSKKIKIESLEKCSKAVENRNIFNNSIRWECATNNSQISELFNTFEKDLIITFENQIKEDSNKIDALRTFL